MGLLGLDSGRIRGVQGYNASRESLHGSFQGLHVVERFGTNVSILLLVCTAAIAFIELHRLWRRALRGDGETRQSHGALHLGAHL